MIQFNLLPDIKQEFVRVNRVKRTVTTVSILASAVFILIFVLLLTWDGLQKKNLSDINRDIKSNQATLTGTKDLNKILTVQNQLISLPTLHAKKPVVSRLFGYLSQITPSTATISTFSIDFSKNTLTFSGDADSLATVNKFADTLKFTTYTAGSSSSKPSAFSNVVLASFGLSQKSVSYTFNCGFDQALFNSNNQVTFSVPPEVTTRSIIDQPTDLFMQSAPNSGNTGSGTQGG